MLKRILFMSLGFAYLLSEGAWARAEFHIGGTTGASWEGFIVDQESSFSVVDGAGNAVNEEVIGIGACLLYTSPSPRD